MSESSRLLRVVTSLCVGGSLLGGAGWFVWRGTRYQVHENELLLASIQAQNRELVLLRQSVERPVPLQTVGSLCVPSASPSALPAANAQAAGAAPNQADASQAPVSNEAALRDSTQLLSRAMAARKWTEQDAIKFRSGLTQLSPEDREALMGELITALNRADLRFEGRGTPF